MEQRTARNWYWWLWLSPLIVVPTFFGLGDAVDDRLWYVRWSSGQSTWWIERVCYSLALLVASLWHLILLVPARNQKHEFVRWHGRQALLLAGVRTVLPFGFVLGFGLDLRTLIPIPILIAVWFFGTLLSQREAARGTCSLMRWRGLAEAQPAREAARESEAEADAEALVEMIRYSCDPEARREALAKLKELGMVESL